MRHFIPHLFFALALSSCAHVASDSSSDSAQVLRAADTALTKAVADKDLEGIVAFYAEDAVLLPTAEPIVAGKSAIRDEWEHILKIPNFQSTSALTKIEVASGGDMAYSMGTYVATMLGEDGKIATEPGKWLSVWQRQGDGTWLIVADTYNTDIPPPDHK